MQQFIRTINTTDAFKIKLEQLEQELRFKTEPLKNKLDALEREYNEYKDVALGSELGGGFLILIGKLVRGIGVLFFAITIFTLLFEYDSSHSDDASLLFFAGSFSLLAIWLGHHWKTKGDRKKGEALLKQKEAEEKRRVLKVQIDELREEIQQQHRYYEEKMNEQKQLFQQHMLNQQELITQEVQTINQVAVGDNLDTKECPQCAELVKVRAKICRFCNYKFEETST